MENQGINNLLKFWSTKVRDNLTNFFADQKLLVLIDEIDQQITKIESRKSALDNEKPKKNEERQKEIKSSTSSERRSIRYQYRPVVKNETNQNQRNNIDSKYNSNTKYNINDSKYNKRYNNNDSKNTPTTTTTNRRYNNNDTKNNTTTTTTNRRYNNNDTKNTTTTTTTNRR